MKWTKTTAIILAAASLLPMTGCTESTTTYELYEGDVTFTVDSSLKEIKDDSLSNTAYAFQLKNTDYQLIIDDQSTLVPVVSHSLLTLECTADRVPAIFGDENGFLPDLETEFLDINGKRTARVKYTDPDDASKAEWDIVEFTDNNYVTIFAMEPDNAKMRTTIDSIISSINSTYEYEARTETETFEDDYFNVTLEPGLNANFISSGEDDDDAAEKHTVRITYDVVDDYTMAWACADVTLLTDDLTPAERADESYEKKSGSKMLNNVERDTGSFFGCPAETVSYTMMFADEFELKTTSFYFEKDGKTYQSTLKYPTENYDTFSKDMQNALKTMELK